MLSLVDEVGCLGPVRSVVPGELQHEPDAEQRLLRTVMQVPLDPAAFVVRGVQDPRPRPLDLRELSSHLDSEPVVVSTRRIAATPAASSFGSSRASEGS